MAEPLPQDRPGWLLPCAAALAVLAGTYAGAYYRLVHRVALPDVVPIYRIRGTISGPEQTWGRFFAPMHWLDRSVLRRSYWKDEA